MENGEIEETSVHREACKDKDCLRVSSISHPSMELSET